MGKRLQRGFIIPIGYVIIIVVLLVITGVGVFVASKNKTPKAVIDSSPTTAQAPAATASKLKNFYDCFETDGRTYSAGSPNKCTAQGKTFSEPTDFSQDNVREAGTLPPGVRGQVFTDAAANFSKCAKDNQDESSVPVTQVLSVLGDDWALIAMSCADNSNEVFMKQPDGTWLRINRSATKIKCAITTKYQVPKELFLTSSNPGDHDAACVNEDGTLSQIPYTYKPGVDS